MKKPWKIFAITYEDHLLVARGTTPVAAAPLQPPLDAGVPEEMAASTITFQLANWKWHKLILRNLRDEIRCTPELVHGSMQMLQ